MATLAMPANRSLILFIIICFCARVHRASSNGNYNIDNDGNGSEARLQRSKRSFWPACYEPLGCFPTTGVFFNLFIRPFQPSPRNPDWIGTAFKLHTRQSSPEKIIAGPDLHYSTFDANKDTKIIVHGFFSKSDVTWMQKMVSKLLRLDDFNVILVDWNRGSLPPYSQAASNTRVVGAQIAQLITSLKDVKGADFGKFHLIGHSLGAHVCGYAGERIQGLGRISGLDPAEPYFEGMDIKVRLDPTDAQFVDVIHTDADPVLVSALLGNGGFGTKQPSGHVDFYVNGGMHQPGCSKANVILDVIKRASIDGIIEGAHLFASCDHVRVLDLYLDSITEQPSCRFTAYPCHSYQEFIGGKCGECGATGCGIMGYYADKAKPKTGGTMHIYFLETAAKEPFCLHHYHVSVVMAHGWKNSFGTLQMEMANYRGGQSTGVIKLNQTPTTFQEGREYGFVVTSQQALNAVKSVSLEIVPIVQALGQHLQSQFGLLPRLHSIVIRHLRDDLNEERAVFAVDEPLTSGQVLTLVRQ